MKYKCINNVRLRGKDIYCFTEGKEYELYRKGYGDGNYMIDDEDDKHLVSPMFVKQNFELIKE